MTAMETAEILDMMLGVLPPTHPQGLTPQENAMSTNMARIAGRGAAGAQQPAAGGQYPNTWFPEEFDISRYGKH